MSATLFDGLGPLINSGLGAAISARLGEPEQNISRGLQAGSTSILAGLANKTDDPVAMKQVFDLIASPAADIRSIEDAAAFADAVQAGGGVAGMSSRFLDDLFGSHASAVNNVVATTSGLSGQSVSKIMTFAAPLVLGFLGRHVRQNGLGLGAFTRLLSDEKNNIMRVAPSGLASALGVEDGRPRDREKPFEPVHRDTQREAEPSAYAANKYPMEEETRGRSGWIWSTVAVIAALALFFTMRSRNHREVASIDTSTSTTSGGEVAPVITPTPSAGATTVVKLPDGTVLAVMPTSIESKLDGFIADPTRMTDKTTWFDFDRLTFASNSASLLPESQDQLANVAKILAAYPNVFVKIGGYTDNVGNAAANKKLSTARAASVRLGLIKAGVAPGRLTSEGYGEEHPVADNSTEEGRAQNRRISVLVIKK